MSSMNSVRHMQCIQNMDETAMCHIRRIPCFLVLLCLVLLCFLMFSWSVCKLNQFACGMKFRQEKYYLLQYWSTFLTINRVILLLLLTALCFVFQHTCTVFDVFMNLKTLASSFTVLLFGVMNWWKWQWWHKTCRGKTAGDI